MHLLMNFSLEYVDHEEYSNIELEFIQKSELGWVVDPRYEKKNGMGDRPCPGC